VIRGIDAAQERLKPLLRTHQFSIDKVLVLQERLKPLLRTHQFSVDKVLVLLGVERHRARVFEARLSPGRHCHCKAVSKPNQV
jgi:hypothetical protein